MYQNKVQKESPKEKKIQNGKLLLRKRKRKGERKKESPKRSCRKIKGERRIKFRLLITKAHAKEMSFKVLELSCEAFETLDLSIPLFHTNP